ncbi:hypothetical protein QFC21_006774 [Naganishia friedmannii]|uniref:Uncharacterized protein n=1 Tax=Naganishia friedmannii TaxID=89922 RepID=A0ACC2UZM7_9TREE|nr:hypothetical protein QFC21_006774 [Naganishia friedmannii]
MSGRQGEGATFDQKDFGKVNAICISERNINNCQKRYLDVKTIWSLDWGRCDLSWLDDKNGRGVNPLLLIVKKREPIFFPDRLITQTCFGLVYLDGVDLDMVMGALGPDYEAYTLTPADNHSGDRKPWTMTEWSEYMRRGSVPRDRLPRPPMTPQHYVFHMLSLEITGTKLVDRFEKPFLQRQHDPFIRFKGQLNVHRRSTAGLYVMNSKAGSFTPWHVDATGAVHWLAVVTGIKWVLTLPPTKSNIDVWCKVTGANIHESWLAEHGNVGADFLWLPDLCADSPVTKQVVTSGQSIYDVPTNRKRLTGA